MSVALLLPTAVYADGAYVVDDAGIAEPGTVQMESWASFGAYGAHNLVANAAYRIANDTEFTLQAQQLRVQQTTDTTLEPQMKYVWLHPQGNYQLSAAIVGAIDYSVRNDKITDGFAYMPVSAKFGSIDLDTNIGFVHQNDTGQNDFYWGIGGEWHARETTSLRAELFQDNGLPVGLQLGPRYHLNDRLALDLIYGRNVLDRGSLWTVGLEFAL